MEQPVARHDDERQHQRAEQHADRRRQLDPEVVDAADQRRQRQRDGEQIYRLEGFGHGCGLDITGASRIESRKELCPRRSLFATQARHCLVSFSAG
jgi:hypothetical protein